MAFDLKRDWGRFHQLPMTRPVFLIDVGRLQRKLDARKRNPLRWQEGTFRLPLGMRPELAEKVAKEAIGKWISALGREGWRLNSDLQVRGPFRAHDLMSKNAVLLGEREYRVRAVFRLEVTPQPLRIEINPALIRRDPEETLTAKEAAKALTIA